jgi:hypothetical protein
MSPRALEDPPRTTALEVPPITTGKEARCITNGLGAREQRQEVPSCLEPT